MIFGRRCLPEPAAYSLRVTRVLARNSAIAAGAVAVNGALSAVLLAFCAAFGQTGEIAAYTVMTSALAFVSIVAGGGSALLYVNGTEEQRAQVRSQWILIVVPAVLVGSLVAGEFYRHRGYGVVALAASGVIVLGNNLAQLQIADFNRRMRFLASAVLMCGSKAVSLLLVLVGVKLTVSLAVVGLVQLAVAEAVLGRRRLAARHPRMAAFPAQRRHRVPHEPAPVRLRRRRAVRGPADHARAVVVISPG